MTTHTDTSDKLLQAAIELMAEKGYDGTTTKEIAAAAGVNEVTLFRRFGTKQGLLEAAFHRFHYAGEMTKLFEEELTGSLQEDLVTVSRMYHRLMHRNRKLLSIAQKGSGSLPEEVYREAARHPVQLKKLMADYLAAMAEKKKVTVADPELSALSFMWMNYGAFASGLGPDTPKHGASLEAFIEESCALFARAMTP
ncbi:helix-turn-helix domain-containing protein [Paenibacillus aurantius]|uniref:Helix-turn-helix domain-containing protein n=1 Tax=Paenibacillus aurantius TaxID=2918900 RepID=A0AA96RHK9_9BACL|nr:helix-turn-helix domain-containing protein [Paenibacillus aurantius]WNQ11219.1 helix-turn-helix domain-containing protein [Paenibacillus aurantius]